MHLYGHGDLAAIVISFSLTYSLKQPVRTEKTIAATLFCPSTWIVNLWTQYSNTLLPNLIICFVDQSRSYTYRRFPMILNMWREQSFWPVAIDLDIKIHGKFTLTGVKKQPKSNCHILLLSQRRQHVVIVMRFFYFHKSQRL